MAMLTFPCASAGESAAALAFLPFFSFVPLVMAMLTLPCASAGESADALPLPFFFFFFLPLLAAAAAPSAAVVREVFCSASSRKPLSKAMHAASNSMIILGLTSTMSSYVMKTTAPNLRATLRA